MADPVLQLADSFRNQSTGITVEANKIVIINSFDDRPYALNKFPP